MYMNTHYYKLNQKLGVFFGTINGKNGDGK